MNESSVIHLADIATSPGPLHERGLALLRGLQRHVPFDSAWLSLAEPRGTGYRSLASESLDPDVERFLSGPQMAHDIEATGAHRDRSPLSCSDLPYPADELETWAECLTPAGYHETLAVGLFVPGSRHVGFLALLSSSKRPPPEHLRRDLARLVPLIARGVDPMLSLTAAARVVQGAEAGVVINSEGGTTALPGLSDDPLLAEGSGVLSAARASLRGGTAYTSFLWPRGGRHAPDGHVRVTVLSGTEDVLGVWSGMALLSPTGEMHGLTPRELEVVGLLVAGCTNQEIAKVLVVATRTVAAHIEHILHKLGAPTRTLAAVRAQRTGLYVPAGGR